MNFFLASLTIYERPAKIALALKNSGHNVILIYCVEPKDSFLKNCFSQCFKIENSEQIDSLINQFKIKLIHIFSTFSDPLALYLVNNKKIKTIYDYKDIFEGLLKLPYEKEYYQQQQFLIENASYVCHRDFQIYDYIKYKNLKNIRKFYYPDLVWSNSPIIKKIKPIKRSRTLDSKLVLIGNFVIESLEPKWSGHGNIHNIRKLLSFGCQVSVYSNALFEGRSQEYLALASEYPKFKVHPEVGISELHAQLYDYDFGIFLTQGLHFSGLDMYVNSSHFMNSIPTRIMDYIGSGLPIIYSDQWRQINILNRIYKFGLPINNLEDFGLKMSELNYTEISRNVIFAATYGLQSDRWISKLIDKYMKIINED